MAAFAWYVWARVTGRGNTSLMNPEPTVTGSGARINWN